MVDVPIHTRRWMNLCLIATLVFGAFMFAAPTHASMTSMPQAGSMDTMPSPLNATAGCFKQGCVQEHATCSQHCVRPSDKSSTPADATITSQSDQQAVSDHIQTRSTEFPNNAPVFLHAPDRAPPIHQFLRSVIKRE